MDAWVRRARCCRESDRVHLSTQRDRARCGVGPDVEVPPPPAVADGSRDAGDDRETSGGGATRRRKIRSEPVAT